MLGRCRNIFYTLFVVLVVCFAAKIPVNAVMLEKIPQVSIVSLEHYPFVEGDNNEFFISSKGYSGNVQYQLFYTCDATMNGQWQLINAAGMVNGWTGEVDSKEPVQVGISSLNLKANNYRFAIRVRRAGVKGKYSNQYGDYDNAYPFNLSVEKSSSITLKGNLSINKTEFTKGEMINISGVEGSEPNLNYKLHLYDTANDRWYTNLTAYGNNISFSTANLPEGKYILDVWGRIGNSSKSYDGWKLKTIQIKKEWIPAVSLVSLEHSPFIEGDGNEFYISSSNFSGQVQYQLFYTSQALMGDKWELFNAEGMKDGWTDAVDASQPLKIKLDPLNLKAGFYRFAIRVRRSGVKGKYSNQYGDYDYAYPFNVDVVKSASIKLSDSILMKGTEYLKNDQLIIDGVKGLGSEVQYKLHLYDVKNNKWLTNLTDYSDSVSFDLTGVPEGTYVVDIWGKNRTSTKSYEGWKLAIIHVGSDLRKIIEVSDINDTAFRNSTYSLPKYVDAKFEDGSVYKRPVTWDSTASTAKTGCYSFQGTLAGYEGKAMLYLNVYDSRGNSVGNTINGGFAVESGGWVYYTNFYEEGSLFKSKPDGTGIKKVTDDFALNLNIIGDYIFYSNYSDGGNIYRIKTDGTERAKIGWDATDTISVVDGWIYYINASDGNKIYRIKSDGSGRIMLNTDKSANLNVVDNYIYYTNIDDGSLYRCTASGTGKTKLSDDAAMFVNVVDGYIYYSNAKDNYDIYKIDINGKNRIRLLNSSAAFLNVYEGKIYYSDVNSNFDLYTVKTDGTDRYLSLQNPQCVLLNISNGAIYYLSNKSEGGIQSMNISSGFLSYLGLRILSLQDYPQITVKAGSGYTLPQSVTANMNDNSTRGVDVLWDTGSLDLNTPGEYTIQGTVKDFDGRAELKITVTE